VAGEIATQPLGPQPGVSGWGSSRRQRSAQNRAVARVSRPGARACSDRTVGALPAKAAAQASTACPVGSSTASARPCPAGADKPGHSAWS
jgi:hypothetical protein